MQPLAQIDNTQLQSTTNLSTSLSLTIFDRNGSEIPFQTDFDHPIELIILRDPNIVIPPMILQNITSFNNNTPHHQLYNLHYIKIPQEQWNSERTVSFIFEMHPLNTSLAYFLIYKFDNAPQLNRTINQIDGWSFFCPLSTII